MERAINACKAALEVFTPNDFPTQWAQTQNSLGNAFSERIREDRAENLERAIRAFEAALEVRTREAFPIAWAQTQNSLGNAFSERIRGEPAENLERAIRAYEAALEVRTREEFPDDWAETQINLGQTYCDRISGDRAKNVERGIEALAAALEVFTRDKQPVHWATAKDGLGNAYLKRIRGDAAENLEQAIRAFEAALEVRTREAFPIAWAQTQNNLGYAYSVRIRGEPAENLERAIETCEAALEVLTPVANPFRCLRTARNLGRVAVGNQRWETAREAFRTAVEAVERSREEALDEERRGEILESAIDVYAGMVEACLRTDAPDQALEYAERSKARGLAELLAGRTLTPSGDVPEDLLRELRALRQRLPALRRQLGGLGDLGTIRGDGAAGKDPPEDEPGSRTGYDLRVQALQQRRAQLEHDVQESQSRLGKVLAEIGRYDPEFRLTQSVPPVRFEDVRHLAGEHEAAVVEWYFTADALHAFVLTTPGTTRPHVVSYSEAERDRIYAWLDEYLRDYNAHRQGSDPHRGAWRNRLGDRLRALAGVLKIEEVLAGVPEEIETLLLIPHRYLHILPLHALPLGEGILLDRFKGGVRYAPSTVLAQLSGRRGRPHFNHLLAVQNPTSDLPFTDLEVADLRRYFAPDEVLQHKGASMDVLRGSESLRAAHCGHFACHGFFNPAQPLNSALVLAGHDTLTLGDIFELPLDACRLVTLSACETGLTDLRSLTDEYVGLPSGFLFAGARCVVSTLWTVNDLSAALLMMRFYELLFDGAGEGDRSLEERSIARTLGEAQRWLRDATGARLRTWLAQRLPDLNLRLTQQRVLIEARQRAWGEDERPFADPFHWAAFVAVGD